MICHKKIRYLSNKINHKSVSYEFFCTQTLLLACSSKMASLHFSYLGLTSSMYVYLVEVFVKPINWGMFAFLDFVFVRFIPSSGSNSEARKFSSRESEIHLYSTYCICRLYKWGRNFLSPSPSATFWGKFFIQNYTNYNFKIWPHHFLSISLSIELCFYMTCSDLNIVLHLVLNGFFPNKKLMNKEIPITSRMVNECCFLLCVLKLTHPVLNCMQHGSGCYHGIQIHSSGKYYINFLYHFIFGIIYSRFVHT